jgi:hypothetical protein
MPLLISGTGQSATGRPRVCSDVERHMQWSRGTAPIRRQCVDPAVLVGGMTFSGVISEEATSKEAVRIPGPARVILQEIQVLGWRMRAGRLQPALGRRDWIGNRNTSTGKTGRWAKLLAPRWKPAAIDCFCFMHTVAPLGLVWVL